MRNRWGVDVRKGHWVRYALPRGGQGEGRVSAIEKTGAYGPRVTLEGGASCGLDDVSLSLGPMKIGRGGVVKQNPTLREVYGSFDAYGKRRFFGPSQNEWGIEHGFPFELESARVPGDGGNAPIQFSKTRAYVCVDEDEYGQPVVEVWPIRNLTHSGVPNMTLEGWHRNPLTRVKVNSPPQRPAGNHERPSERLKKRRRATAKAPEGVYANPLVRVKVNSPPQRPAGNSESPSARLKARRRATNKAPDGYYANPGNLRFPPGVQVAGDGAKASAGFQKVWAVHWPHNPPHIGFGYFTKKADAVYVARDVADRHGKKVAVSPSEVWVGK